MDDCAALIEIMMQWMSSSLTVPALKGDPVGGGSKALCPGLSPKQMASLVEMDKSDNLDVLLKLVEAAAGQKVKAGAFRATFDLEN